MFADVESLLVSYLSSVENVKGVSVETPNFQPEQFANQLPFIQVTALPGTSDYLDASTPVDLDVISDTRASALELARTVLQKLLQLRHTAVNGVLVDDVHTFNGPFWVNYDDENLQRYVIGCTIDSRISAQSL